MRTDINRNPIACTTDLARMGLTEGIDYSQGSLFTETAPGPQGVPITRTYYTAKFLNDPIDTSIKLIDRVGFYTTQGAQRWIYIAIPVFVWRILTPQIKVRVIQFMYQHEGGTEMNDLFTKRLEQGS